jgi:hypothetical protein
MAGVHIHAISTIEDHGPLHSRGTDGKDGYITIVNEDGQWELRDPAYLARIRAIYADAFKGAPPPPATDRKREMELDQRQAVLNEQMQKLAERRAALSIQQAHPTHPTDREAYAEGNAAIGREQADIARQMAEIGRQRAEQGRTQAEWGRTQAEAGRKANEQVQAVIADARRNHKLTPIN